MENQIKKVTVELMDNGSWRVDVLKAFAPEYGGGEQTFSESAPTMWRAMDVARGMVTMSPGSRTDVEAQGETIDPEDCDCDDRSWYGPQHDSACPLAGEDREVSAEILGTDIDGNTVVRGQDGIDRHLNDGGKAVRS